MTTFRRSRFIATTIAVVTAVVLAACSAPEQTGEGDETDDDARFSLSVDAHRALCRGRWNRCLGTVHRALHAEAG